MITDPLELATQRRMTRAFIDADHEIIVLTPYERTKTDTGGSVDTPLTPREPQKFHVIETDTAAPSTRVPGGEKQTVDFVILGNWDAEVFPQDRFSLRGAEWEVKAVQFFNGYEQRAYVIRHGR